MKLKFNFVTNKVADNIVAVAVGDDITQFNGFIKMNETGAEIFDLLKEDITIEDLVSEMADRYSEDSKEEIEKTVKEFVAELQKSGVVE